MFQNMVSKTMYVKLRVALCALVTSLRASRSSWLRIRRRPSGHLLLDPDLPVHYGDSGCVECVVESWDLKWNLWLKMVFRSVI